MLVQESGLKVRSFLGEALLQATEEDSGQTWSQHRSSKPLPKLCAKDQSKSDDRKGPSGREMWSDFRGKCYRGTQNWIHALGRWH